MKIIDTFTVNAFLSVLLISILCGFGEAALFYVFYVFIGGEDKSSILSGLPIGNIFLSLVIITTSLRLLALVFGANITRLLSNRLVKKALMAFNHTSYSYKKTSDVSELLGIVVTRIASIQNHLFQSGTVGLSALIQAIFTILIISHVSDVNMASVLYLLSFYLLLIFTIQWKVMKIGVTVSETTDQQFFGIRNFISNIKYYLIRDQLDDQANKIVKIDYLLRKLGATMTILNGMPKILIELGLFVLLFLVAGNTTAGPEVLPEVILFLLAALRLIPLMQVIYSSSITMISAIPNFKVTQEKLSIYFEQFEKTQSCHRNKFKSLDISNINFSVEDKDILKDVSLSFFKGEKLIILGASGSGKSTLVEIICGLISPPQMHVLLSGKEVETLNDTEWRKNISYVDQDGTLSTRNLRDVFGPLQKETVDEKAIRNLLETFELQVLTGDKDFLDIDYGDEMNLLSGGQRARVKICAAILSGTEIIILDETLANIDDHNDQVIINALKKQKATIILISHKSYHHSDFKVLVDLN